MKAKNYYRIITVSLPQSLKKILKKKDIHSHMLNYLIFFLVCLSVCMVFCLGLVYLNFIEITQARKRVEDNFSYWQGVVKKNPNFTQGYYNAGLYASELGDYKSAVNFLDQAIRLDPTFKKAILLEKEILR